MNTTNFRSDMKIISLELYRHAILRFGNIDKITYTPTAVTQVIIGSNGCGKSTLLSELNPLPPPGQNMLNGGYKTIVIEHKGEIYKLHSSYDKKQRHSFIHQTGDGDIELNDGGTSVAQKTLVVKVFGLDLEIWRLWSGRATFTGMPPIKRRDWILKLSGSDLTYAMKIYNFVRGRVNEVKAVEKHLSQRLSDEVANVATREHIEELEDRLATLTAEVSELLEQRDNKIPDAASIRLEMDRLSRDFDQRSQAILLTRITRPDGIPSEIRTNAELDRFIEKEINTVESLEVQVEGLYAQLAEMTNTTTVDGSLSELQAKEKELCKQSDELRKEGIISDTHDPVSLYNKFNSIKGILTDALLGLTDNSDLRYTRDKVAQCKGDIATLTLKVKATSNRITELNHALGHIDQLESLNCPKCNHLFKPGTPPDAVDRYKKELSDLSVKSDDLNAKLIDKEAYYAEAKEYGSQVAVIKRIIDDNHELMELWNKLHEENLFRVHPHTHMATISSFADRLDRTLKDLDINKQISDIGHLCAAIASADASGATLKQIRSNTESKLDALLETISVSRANIHQYKVYARVTSTISENYTQITKIIDRLQGLQDTLIKSTINQAVCNVLHDKHMQVANINNALNRIGRHEAVISELTSQKDLARQDLLDYTTVMKAISPVDGLISRYIQNFLDTFVEDVNIIIADIWSTDMEVLSCGVDSTDVTCKFPLSVHGGKYVSTDISESSAGQKDIINYAFNRVMGEYLNLVDYPLMLDELSRAFDEQHRENMTRHLNDLIESNQYPQIFMVSHYASNHYAFANSQVLMMDAKNILVKPKEYNEHAQIEHFETELGTT